MLENECTVFVSSCLSGRVASAILFFNEKDRICMWNVVDIEKIMQTIPTELEASEFKENYL